jgi:hypothetical protein
VTAAFVRRAVATLLWKGVTGDGRPADEVFIEDGCELVGAR